jgi:hypothetical protein
MSQTIDRHVGSNPSEKQSKKTFELIYLHPTPTSNQINVCFMQN